MLRASVEWELEYSDIDEVEVNWENALDEGEIRSSLMQYYLEGSNVQLVDEMVNLIVAQRAYEINSKAINAADEMLQQANNLRR